MPHQVKWLLPIVILVSTLLGWYWLNSRSLENLKNSQKKSEPSSAGLRQAPPLDLKDSSGAIHRLEEFRGNVVVIHFWASWCPPCLGEIPKWVAFASKYKGRAVIFVAISLDTNWNEALEVLPFAMLPGNVVSLIDTNGTVAENYGSFQYPETYFLNKDLQTVTKLVGAQNWDAPELRSFMEKLL